MTNRFESLKSRLTNASGIITNHAGVESKYFEEENNNVDANFVSDFGADPFYVRIWGMSVIGDSLTIADPLVSMDASWVGKSINIKETDNTRSEIVTSSYKTITAVIDSKNATLDTPVDIDNVDTVGYAFFDNTTAIENAITAAAASGKSYRIFVPAGTYVIPSIGGRRNFSNGAPLFIGDETLDIKQGSASFKFLIEEEKPPSYNGFFSFNKAEDVGSFKMGFDNVNVLPVDSYSYDFESVYAIFDLPSNLGTYSEPFDILYNGCDFRKEKVQYNTQIEAYLERTGRGGVNLEYFKEYFFPFAHDCIFSVAALTKANGEPHLLTITNSRIGNIKSFQIVISAFTNEADSLVFAHSNVDIYGTQAKGRTGVAEFDVIKPTVDLIADVDGDYTVLQINANTPRTFNFGSIANQYDAYNWKRTSVATSIQIPTVYSNPILQFIHQSKNYGLVGNEQGQVQDSIHLGDGVYDVFLNLGVAVFDGLSYRNRINGCDQWDYLISDNGGTLQNVSYNETDSLVAPDGQPRDYRGWCILPYGCVGFHPDLLGVEGRTEEVFNVPSNDIHYSYGAIEVYIDNDNITSILSVGDTVKWDNNNNSNVKTGYVKQITEIPSKGSKLILWSSETQARFTADAYITPGYSVSKSDDTVLGDALFVIKTQTGNNGATFTNGETLYAHYLGSGDASGAGTESNPSRYQVSKNLLPKYFARPTPFTEEVLEQFTYREEGATHYMYIGAGMNYSLEDVNVVEGLFSLFIRNNGGASGSPNRSVLIKNSSQDFTSGIQDSNLTGLVTIDGGKYKAYGNLKGIVHTYNNPNISGVVDATIIPQDGTGYTLNNIFIPS